MRGLVGKVEAGRFWPRLIISGAGIPAGTKNRGLEVCVTSCGRRKDNFYRKFVLSSPARQMNRTQYNITNTLKSAHRRGESLRFKDLAFYAVYII